MKNLDNKINNFFENLADDIKDKLDESTSNLDNQNNESEEESEYEEEEYEEEEYDEEEYEDDESDEDSLSEEEIALLTTDYSQIVSDDSIEELKFLLDSYFKIKKINAESEEIEELINYSQDVIRAIILEYEIPTDDLFYLFRFVLVLESYYEKNKKDIIFKEVDKDEDLKTLKLRVDEYLNDYPSLFEDFEVYQHIFELDKSFTKLPTYNTVVDKFYSVLISNPSAGTFEYLMELYNQGAYKAENNLEKMPVPEDNVEELATSFSLMLNSKDSSVLKKKIQETKSIIKAKYPNVEILKNLLDILDAQDVAKKYKKIKFGSLGLAIFLGLISMYFGAVLLIAWVVLFLTPVHDKIPFLVKGKECYKKMKK